MYHSRYDFQKITGDIEIASTLADYLNHLKGRSDSNFNYESPESSSNSTSQNKEETKKQQTNIIGKEQHFLFADILNE